jgi:hypothetical protein
MASMKELVERGRERTDNGSPAGQSDQNDNRVLPSASTDQYDDSGDGYRRRQISRSEEESVEVVLGGQGAMVVDAPKPPRTAQDQNVFRPPRPVRPRALRAQGGGHHQAPPPYVQGSSSYGYGPPPPPPPPPADYGHRPYPVASYNPSGSFDDGSYQHQSHYSPHIQYPPPGRHPSDDVNVISPNHKDHRSPGTPRRHGAPNHYQYPPTSPVSRPGGPQASSPPRLRNYAMRREGPYSAAQRSSRHADDGTFNPYPTPPSTLSLARNQPPLVTESSFDSDYHSAHHSHASHPTTPNAPHYGPPMHDAHTPHPNTPYSGYHGGGSFGVGSFDSHAPPPPPAAHYYDDRSPYYGHSPHHPPESPYSHYSYQGQGYSPGGYYDHYSSPHSDYQYRPPHSYEDGDHMDNYHRGNDSAMPNDAKSNSASGVLPKAAQEVDFDVSDPPMEPICPASREPVCGSPGEINSYDVLCGRGGGTNSQVGNRRFRQLVQDFQPTYLLARRKEKPLLARSIVLIIRKRGGRFLKKDEDTGELFEVGDSKAEAKTSQALREGLDVRATKSAASSLMDKKKKKGKGEDDEEEEELSPKSVVRSSGKPATSKATESPPILPRLQGEKPPSPRPASPQEMQFRKRRRMRSGDSNIGCTPGFGDKLFSEFCPPRAHLARALSPTEMEAHNSTPRRRNNTTYDDDDIRQDQNNCNPSVGCAGIALDMVTGAAAGSFCLGPRKWR